MTEYKYSLKRSRRRSICIKIGADNLLGVSAPLRTSVVEIERFINSKSAWIERHIRQNQRKSERLSGVLALKTVLVSGRELPLIIGEKDCIYPDYVSVKSLSHLKKLFIDSLSGQFLNEFEEIRARYGFDCKKVTFRNYRSMWGSCFANGNIVFNFKLLMLPHDLQIYVAVHELCHTRVMNHSPKFYEEVARILPDYKLSQKKLKEYSPVVRLY